MLRATISAIAVLMLAAPALAAEPTEPPPRYELEQHLTFEDDSVIGTIFGPQGTVVSAGKTPPASTLMVVRRDFIPELIQSAENL